MTHESLGFVQAVKAVRNIFRLNVCFSDYTGQIAAAAGTALQHHTTAFCSLIKGDPYHVNQKCIYCDVQLVNRHIQNRKEPFIKQCHAGVHEGVFPVHINDTLIGLLFIGQFRWTEGSAYPEGTLTQPLSAPVILAKYQYTAETLPLLDFTRWQDLCAIGRLLAISLEKAVSFSKTDLPFSGDYKKQIETVFRQKAGTPFTLPLLAQDLCLSVSRTSQLVKLHFNKTFPALLLEHRMERAETLLSGSLFSVGDVARLCGVEDQSYFHRLFRNHSGTTPSAFRRKTGRSAGF